MRRACVCGSRNPVTHFGGLKGVSPVQIKYLVRKGSRGGVGGPGAEGVAGLAGVLHCRGGVMWVGC